MLDLDLALGAELLETLAFSELFFFEDEIPAFPDFAELFVFVVAVFIFFFF
jgi:hypothetical protein